MTTKTARFIELKDHSLLQLGSIELLTIVQRGSETTSQCRYELVAILPDGKEFTISEYSYGENHPTAEQARHWCSLDLEYLSEEIAKPSRLVVRI
jgi:hypothetical protein